MVARSYHTLNLKPSRRVRAGLISAAAVHHPVSSKEEYRLWRAGSSVPVQGASNLKTSRTASLLAAIGVFVLSTRRLVSAA